MPRRGPPVIRQADEWRQSTFRHDDTVDDKNRRWRRVARYLNRVKTLAADDLLPQEPTEELMHITLRCIECWKDLENKLEVEEKWREEDWENFPNVADADMLECYLEHAVESERISFRKDAAVIVEYYERHPREGHAFGQEAHLRFNTTSNRINGRSERVRKAKPLLMGEGWSKRALDVANLAVNMGLRATDALEIRRECVEVEDAADGAVKILVRSNGKDQDKEDRLLELRCGCRMFDELLKSKSKLRSTCVCQLGGGAASGSLATRVAAMFPITEDEFRTAMARGGGTMHSARRTAMVALTVAAQEGGLYFNTDELCRQLAWGSEGEMRGYTWYASEFARLPLVFPTSLFAVMKSNPGCINAKRLQYITSYEVEVPRQTRGGIMVSRQARTHTLPDVPLDVAALPLSERRTSLPLGVSRLQSGVLPTGSNARFPGHQIVPKPAGTFAGGLLGGIRRAALAAARGQTEDDVLDTLDTGDAGGGSSASGTGGDGGAPDVPMKRRRGRPCKGEEAPKAAFPKKRKLE